MSGPQDRIRAQAAGQRALEALRRGDAPAAQRGFEEAIALGASPPPLFLLAQAARTNGDAAAQQGALDRLLTIDPRHIGALLMRGELAVRANDPNGATAFYQQAMRVIDAAGSVSDSLKSEVARARTWLESQSSDYRAHIEARLADAGFGTLPPRMREAIDILCGEKRVFLQQPTSFFYPGLPHRQFYDPSEFAWTAALEAATGAIHAELEAFLGQRADAFHPYVESVPGRPNKAHSLLDDPSWSALDLWNRGEATEHAPRFPAAMAALAAAPIPRIAGRSPMALFSMLRPGAHIQPHNGMINTRLICHLPLIVPPGCAIRVGNETRSWDPGRLLMFDDSIEHEAWNRGGAIRIILLFEVWRPELSEEERAALTTMYESVDVYGED
jgi:tetratricopeptide (TPR) repeat protein